MVNLMKSMKCCLYALYTKNDFRLMRCYLITINQVWSDSPSYCFVNKLV